MTDLVLVKYMEEVNKANEVLRILRDEIKCSIPLFCERLKDLKKMENALFPFLVSFT